MKDFIIYDNRLVCAFRTNNKEAFEETFTKVLLLAHELKVLKKKGGSSGDGTKVKANASKHKAVSYKRAGEIIREMEAEVKELMKLAEEVDGKGLENGFVFCRTRAYRKRYSGGKSGLRP